MEIQIYCRRPSLGETHALLGMGVDLIGWHAYPHDGEALIQAREIATLVRRAGARSSLLVHSRKIAVLAEVAQMVRSDFLLLSSDRDDAQMPQLARSVGPETGLMMSVPVRPTGSAAALGSAKLAETYSDYAAYLTVDTCLTEQPDRGFGCTGVTNDWSICAEIVRSVGTPVILAGGLNPDNVVESIRQVRPAAVDACTSLEYADKSKNLEECQRFVEAVRGAKV